MKKANPIKKWMHVATVKEQDAMAKLAGTTRAMLYQYGGGFRETSAERAAQIELATQAMHKQNKKLPVLFRSDLSNACAKCPFARKCLGVKSEFELN